MIIENMIIEEIKKEFPLKPEMFMNSKTVKNVSSAKYVFSSNKKFEEYITGSVFVIKSGEKEAFLFNVGTAYVPRIILVKNFEDSILDDILKYLYGNFKSVITSLKKQELKDLKRNPLLFFIVERYQRRSGSKYISSSSNLMSVYYQEAILEFLRNYLSDGLSSIYEIENKRFVSIVNIVLRDIFKRVFCQSIKEDTWLIVKNTLEKNRSMFLGFYCYSNLMSRVKYSEAEWNSFFETYIFNGFKEKMIYQLNNIDNVSRHIVLTNLSFNRDIENLTLAENEERVFSERKELIRNRIDSLGEDLFQEI